MGMKKNSNTIYNHVVIYVRVVNCKLYVKFNFYISWAFYKISDICTIKNGLMVTGYLARFSM